MKVIPERVVHTKFDIYVFFLHYTRKQGRITYTHL